MSVHIGPYTFESSSYEAAVDILTVGQTGEGEDSPEGHVFQYAFGTDDLIGVEFMDARAFVERDGALRITLPDGETVSVLEDVTAALAAR